MKKLYVIFLVLVSFVCSSQTMIEMTNPNDANIVLLEVQYWDEADIVVYKTDDKDECEEWNCKWLFKEWGFSNFSVYIAQSVNDSLLFMDETNLPIPIAGTVYFSRLKASSGYRNDKVHLDGMMRVTRTKEE